MEIARKAGRFRREPDTQSRAELALIASRFARTERSMAALLENLPATVVRFDAGLCIRFANRAYLGIPPRPARTP